jgi:hypothetical protein
MIFSLFHHIQTSLGSTEPPVKWVLEALHFTLHIIESLAAYWVPVLIFVHAFPPLMSHTSVVLPKFCIGYTTNFTSTRQYEIPPSTFLIIINMVNVLSS